ncbi:unnamed protein product [Mytilus edulis]|uniref:DNA-directed DNA polymerase n=1 Tax=Mytilus edulis TaxID=6550 RepID=A0A8S3SSP4_MYTED|nr:unnamed protein product [Mytilus edulis]
MLKQRRISELLTNVDEKTAENVLPDSRRKGYFPHFFNKIENQNYIGEYPAPQDYDMNSMNVEDRHDFLKWYKEKKSKGAISDFAKEIEACCRVDVTILRKACLKFRELILTQTNYEVDAFDSVTIASMCMTIFRTCFLQEEHRVHLVTNTDLALRTRWVNGHGKVWYFDRWLSPKDLLHTHNHVVECKKTPRQRDRQSKEIPGMAHLPVRQMSSIRRQMVLACRSPRDENTRTRTRVREIAHCSDSG